MTETTETTAATVTTGGVPACDNASVGVVIHDPVVGRWLMFERGRAPIGVAPVAGHVFDEHAEPGTDDAVAYEVAARAEVFEELGLTVVDLVDTGVGGWRANRCRRWAGPGGVGHFWRVYTATVTGQLAPSLAEAVHPQWFTRAQLQDLADVTVAYARGGLDEDDWAARPGIEPVWVAWLAELGLITVTHPDLALIDQVAAGHGVQLDEPLDLAEAEADEPPSGEARRVVFGDELAVGAVLFACCHGSACEYPAPSCRSPRGERPDHRVTLTRLRYRGNGLTGVVVDADGAEWPWRGWADEPVTVAADTITGQGIGRVGGQDDDGPGDAWAGIPADPRWDPYRLRVRRARWWRPWWTVCVDYVGLWASAGDQTIIVVRSRDVLRARARAVDTLIGHCRWLAARDEYAADTVPVLWKGAGLVPVAHLAAQSMHQWPTRNCAAATIDAAGEAVNAR